MARGLASPMAAHALGAPDLARSPLSPTAEIAAQVAAARQEGAVLAEAQAQLAAGGAGWGESDVACAGGGAVMAPGAAPPQGAVGGQGADSMAQDSMVAAMMTEAGWTEAQAPPGVATPRGLTAAVHAARGAPPTHAVEVDATIRRMFERFDVNKSGTLCHRELGACLQSLGIDTTHSEAASALRAYDADANGVMELDEFARLVHQLGWAQGGGGHGLGFAAMANSMADREEAVATAAGKAGGAGAVARAAIQAEAAAASIQREAEAEVRAEAMAAIQAEAEAAAAAAAAPAPTVPIAMLRIARRRCVASGSLAGLR